MTTVVSVAQGRSDLDYPNLLTHLQHSFEQALQTPQAGLFTTAIDDDLYDIFLAELPEDIRPIHLCRACRNFTRRFGGLVTIDGSGNTIPVMWNPAEVAPVFALAVARLRRRVQDAPVSGVFLSDQPVWGTPQTGAWTHFAIHPPATLVYFNRVKTAAQAAAEKLEDFRTMQTALAEFPMEAVTTAVSVLRSETLYRSEKVLGVAEWLRDLHEQRAAQKSKRRRDHVLWRAVATAPAGFCHPRSSMIGTLLEDIQANYPFDALKRRFDAKMNPLLHARPQAAPTAGNIAQAEKIIAQLGAAGSLARRYATLDDLQTVWKPAATPAGSGTGVFGHLTPKGKLARPASQLAIPTMTMTWVKFAEKVLPTAEALEVFATDMGDYTALLTAQNPEAPPIIQWDQVLQRNPVSWYVYPTGSPAHQWGLQARSWCKVTGISFLPPMWHGGTSTHFAPAAIFILAGAKDSQGSMSGSALFPEILKSEFHPIRATIEQYSMSDRLGGQEAASACGLMFNRSGNNTPLERAQASGNKVRLRVTTAERTDEYLLDRWD